MNSFNKKIHGLLEFIGTIACRPITNQPPIRQTAYHRACMHVTVPETEVVGKQRPHPAVRDVTTWKFE
jgi:hypothetical protein